MIKENINFFRIYMNYHKDIFADILNKKNINTNIATNYQNQQRTLIELLNNMFKHIYNNHKI